MIWGRSQFRSTRPGPAWPSASGLPATNRAKNGCCSGRNPVCPLTGTAPQILALCDGRRSIGEIAASLAERFGAELDVVSGDVARFLQDLAAGRARACDEPSWPDGTSGRVDAPLPASLRVLLEPGRRTDKARASSTRPVGRGSCPKRQRSVCFRYTSPAVNRYFGPILPS